MNRRLKKLKILYLVKTMDVGGAERITLSLCRYFSDRFNDITVFSSGGILEKELCKFNINHIKYTGVRKRNIPGLRNALNKTIQNGNFDIIHSQHRIFLPLLKTINTGRSKIIYTANNYFNDIYQKILFADAAVAISPAIESNLKNTAVLGDDKIYRINYGVRIKDSPLIRTGKPVFGFFGRLIKKKGIFPLIRAIQDLPAGNMELIICGNGPEEEKIRGIINSPGTDNKIRLMGPVTDVDRFYDKIDTLVLPTEFNEGLPVSVLEAMSRKKLVITTGAGAIKDVIKDGETGHILANNSPSRIKNKILHVINSGAENNLIRKNGYEKVKEEYSLEAMLNGHENLYRQVLL